MTAPRFGLEPLSREAMGAVVAGLPAALAYGFLPLQGTIDIACLGTSRTTSIAALGLGASVLSPFCVLVTGIALALPSEIAGPAAKRDVERATSGAASCLRAQAAVAVLSMVGIWALAAHLQLLAQTPEVTAASAGYLRAASFAVVPAALFATLREHAMTMGARVAPAGAAAAGLLVKAALDFVLAPFAGAGLVFAALSTIAASSIACLVLLAHLVRQGLLRYPANADGTRRFLAIGLPISLQQLVELGAFYTAGILSGALGVESLATFSVAMNVVNFSAFLSLSVAQTTGTMVARHRTGASLQRRAGNFGAAMAIAIAGTMGVVVLAFPRIVATDGSAVIGVTLAVGLVADAAQMTYGGALRALVDHRFLTTVSIVAWWALAVPGAYVLGVRAGLGVAGIWLSLTSTLILVAIVLRARFVRLTGARSAAPTPSLAPGVNDAVAFD